MNYSTVVFLVNKNVRAIKCAYEVNDKGEPCGNLTIFKSFDHSIKVGDDVVVPTETRVKRTVVRVQSDGPSQLRVFRAEAGMAPSRCIGSAAGTAATNSVSCNRSAPGAAAVNFAGGRGVRDHSGPEAARFKGRHSRPPTIARRSPR